MVVYTTVAVLVETTPENRLKFAAEIEYILCCVEITALAAASGRKT